MSAGRHESLPPCEYPTCGDAAVYGTAFGGWRCGRHNRSVTCPHCGGDLLGEAPQQVDEGGRRR